MSLVKHNALLKNERLKLYKKPSTWVLMGIIVLLAVLNLLFSKLLVSSFQNFNPTWQEQYNENLEGCNRYLKDNPDDKSIQNEVDTLKYLLDNDISPLDWRTDVVIEYYSLKSGVPVNNDDFSKGFPQEQSPAVNLTQEEIQTRLTRLQSILEVNNWKDYVNLKISDLNSGWTPSVSVQEKNVDIEMYKLYIKQEIIPVALNSNRYYYGGGSDDEDMIWKSQQVKAIRQNKLNLVRGENEYGQLITHSQQDRLKQDVDTALLRLKTNTPPVAVDSFLGLLESSASFSSLLSVLLIVYAGGIFASEYGSGTIKFLLITPHRRRSIFWAKTVLMLEMTAIALGLVFILSFLLSGAFTGFKGIGSMQVIPLFGNIVRLPYLLFIALRYLLMLLPVLAYGAMAMMLSVVTRKSSVAIAVTMVIVFGSEIIMTILKALSGRMVIPGIKFLLFANTTPEVYLPSAGVMSMLGAVMSGTVDGTMTLGFSISILLIYLTCFLWIARDSFCRRDVK